MSLRRQLPVYSPLPPSALLKGAGALLFGSTGPRRSVLQWIETEFEARQHLLTDSGTSALALAMTASQQDGRSVILLPAYGCYDLVTAALAAEVPVRWYDLDPATLGPDWDSLERELKADVAAVVLVHFFGLPVDLRRGCRLADAVGALIIEDAAQGTGGMADERPLGSLGDFGVLSFGRGKGLTSGGGGALLANSLAAREAFARSSARVLSSRGRIRPLVASLAQWLLARPSVYGFPAGLPFLHLGETVFRAPASPRAITPTALGILSGTIEEVHREADIRRKHAARLTARLRGRAAVPVAAAGRPGFLRLPVLLRGRQRALGDTNEAQELGIMPGYPRVLSSLPGPTASAQRYAGAEFFVQSLVTLPVHSRLREEDLVALEHWIEKIDDSIV